MLFVSVSCLLFGINLYCNSGPAVPPRPSLTKATLSFHGKKMRPHITEKCWGREICADEAVARPSRCRTSHVQIVSHQQKGLRGSHVVVVVSAAAGRMRSRSREKSSTEHACLCSPGPVRPHRPTPPHPTPASKKALQRLPRAACLGRMVQACPFRVQELTGSGDV